MNIDYVYDALAALRSYLPLLDDALQPGTPRRWSQTELTPEQREKLDEQARAERAAKVVNLARDIKALGDGRAPLRLDVLDAIGAIHAGVNELEAAVCEKLEITPLEHADPAQRIGRLIGLLRRVEGYGDLGDFVSDEATRLRSIARRAVGDNEPILNVKGPCPLCAVHSLRAFPERGVVVCLNSECQCGAEDCYCWEAPRPGTHRWYESSWEKLSDDSDKLARRGR